MFPSHEKPHSLKLPDLHRRNTHNTGEIRTTTGELYGLLIHSELPLSFRKSEFVSRIFLSSTITKKATLPIEILPEALAQVTLQLRARRRSWSLSGLSSAKRRFSFHTSTSKRHPCSFQLESSSEDNCWPANPGGRACGRRGRYKPSPLSHRPRFLTPTQGRYRTVPHQHATFSQFSCKTSLTEGPSAPCGICRPLRQGWCWTSRGLPEHRHCC